MRKSINAGDIFEALRLIELDQALMGRLHPAVAAFQQINKEKRQEYRSRKSLQNQEPNDVAQLTDSTQMDVDNQHDKRIGEDLAAEDAKRLEMD